MDSAEQNRLLANLIRVGTILEVDHARARCRVKSGKLETNWIAWLEHRAGATRSWDPPTVGEQCVLLCPSGEPASAIALVGLYSDARPAPVTDQNKHHTRYPDGAVIEYDHAAGALKATGIKTALVQASKHCTIDCPENTITGNTLIKGTLTVEKLFTYQAGMKGTGGEGASAIINGRIETTQDVVAGGISLMHHTHPESIGDHTGEPQ